MKLRTAAAKARQKKIASLIKEGRLGALCAFAAGAAMVGGCSKEKPETRVEANEEVEVIEMDVPEVVTNKGMEMKPMQSMGRAPLGKANRTNEAQVASFRSVGLRPPTKDEAKALTNLMNEAESIKSIKKPVVMGLKIGEKNKPKEK